MIDFFLRAKIQLILKNSKFLGIKFGWYVDILYICKRINLNHYNL